MKPIELDELGPGVERLLTPEQGRSLAASGVVTATVLPLIEEYQLYSHHWAFGMFCWATESPSEPLMFQ